MVFEPTPCQKIDAILSRYRRPISLDELISKSGADGQTVVDTVNKMLGVGLLIRDSADRVRRVCTYAEASQ